MTTEHRKHLTEVEAALTGRRYCTGCNTLKTVDGGVMRGEGRGKRWNCADCEARRKTRTKSDLWR